LKIFYGILTFLGLKFTSQAVQEIMEMKMAEHIRESLEKSLPDLATNQKLAKNMKLDTPLVVSRGTARSAMSKFSNKTAEMTNGQFDCTNLRFILDNCKLFAGWRKEQADGQDGWLLTFQHVSKMRNEFIGHNNAQLIRKLENNSFFKRSKNNIEKYKNYYPI